MRILVFGMSGRLTGGIETFLLNMNACMSKDCIFDYVITDGENIHSDRIRAQGGESFIVTPVKKNPIKNLIELDKIIKKNRQDHPVAYFNLFSMVHIVPVLKCRAKGYRIVLHAHNSRLQQKSRLYYILHLLGRKILKNTECLRLTNSDSSAEFMFGKDSGAKLIYNAVDVERFRFNEDDRKEIRAKYGVENKTVVGFSGRLSELKNPLFLIDIFKEFHLICKESVLLITGDGELREAVEKKINEYGLNQEVFLPGTVKDVDKYYRAFDLFIFPSKSEGLGIALVEAQTSGLPAVASKDVIPDIATVTKWCIRESLEDPAKVWAADALSLLNECRGSDRNEAYDVVKNSNFNMKKEARNLEKLLLSKGNIQ